MVRRISIRGYIVLTLQEGGHIVLSNLHGTCTAMPGERPSSSAYGCAWVVHMECLGGALSNLPVAKK